MCYVSCLQFPGTGGVKRVCDVFVKPHTAMHSTLTLVYNSTALPAPYTRLSNITAVLCLALTLLDNVTELINLIT